MAEAILKPFDPPGVALTARGGTPAGIRPAGHDTMRFPRVVRPAAREFLPTRPEPEARAMAAEAEVAELKAELEKTRRERD